MGARDAGDGQTQETQTQMKRTTRDGQHETDETDAGDGYKEGEAKRRE